MATKKEKSELINLVEKNKGNKIPFAIDGNRITFGDDELTINIERHERDFENSLDICRDVFGNLVMGVIPGRAEAFVAQIVIPPREFESVADSGGATAGRAEAGIAMAMSAGDLDGETGEADDMPDFETEQEALVPIPFSLKRCTLTLWALV